MKWLVVRIWDEYEQSVDEFITEEEATHFFDFWVNGRHTCKIYLAKIEKESN